MAKHDWKIIVGLALMLEPAAEALWDGLTWAQFFAGIAEPAICWALAGFLVAWRGYHEACTSQE